MGVTVARTITGGGAGVTSAVGDSELIFTTTEPTFVNILLNFLLIKNWGLFGSALAFLISMLFWAILTMYQGLSLLKKMKSL